MSRLPSSASFHSSSAASSQSRARRDWADVEDDDSCDELWTPSSAATPYSTPSLPPASTRSLPHVRTEPSCHDDDEELPSTVSLLQPGGESGRSSRSYSSVSRRDSDMKPDAKTPRGAELLTASSLIKAKDEQSCAEVASTAAASNSSAQTQQEGSWSAGAEFHSAGTCHPCIFYPKPVGCDNGEDCSFCHLAHESRARHRRHMRRGHAGRLAAAEASGSEVTDGNETTSTGYESSTNRHRQPQPKAFALPSALAPVENPWPKSVRWSEDRLAVEHQLTDVLTEQRHEALRSSATSASSSASTRCHEDGAEEPPSVLTLLLAPIFGNGGPSLGAEAKTSGKQGKGYGKARQERPNGAQHSMS